MGRIFSKICYFLIVLFLSGCILDSDSKKTVDKGSFNLFVSPLQFKSYPGGGGLVFISLVPDTNFAGDVDLWFGTDKNITLIPEKSILSLNKLIEEIEVYPDTTVTPGESQINVKYQHGDITDFLTVEIILFEADDILYQFSGFGKNPPEVLLQWLFRTYPEYNIEADNSWFCWCDEYAIGAGFEFSSSPLPWLYRLQGGPVCTFTFLLGLKRSLREP